MLADLELGFLLEVFLELELGLSVQLAVALVDRNLVRGPARKMLLQWGHNVLSGPVRSRCVGVGVICQVPILNWPSGGK